MKFNPLPSKERIEELLDYNPATGQFIWKIGRGNMVHKGAPAGTIRTYKLGYKRLEIAIDNVRYKAHRIAYYLQTGEQPKYIDHKNGDGLDNRISNLRAADRKLNQNNMKMQHNNKSGVIGVSYDKSQKRWDCQYGSRDFVRINKTRKFFYDFFEAVCQRKSWEVRFGMEDLKKFRV